MTPHHDLAPRSRLLDLVLPTVGVELVEAVAAGPGRALSELTDGAAGGRSAGAGVASDGRVTDSESSQPVTHLEVLPPRPAGHAPWPAWAPPTVVEAFRGRGVREPFSHQIEAAELAHAGRHVVLATGTASGKSMAYQLPALSDLTADPRATVLYIAPTKALAADQLSSLHGLGIAGVHPSLFDGDTPVDVRDWVRSHSRWVLTNPDMIHRGLLPQHARWIRFLRRLRYVVVDECHAYRGVFGSHIALVLRRLLRIAERYGAHPTVVLASATVGDPAASATRLIGRDVVAVTEDGAPRPGAEFLLWEPGSEPSSVGPPMRRSAPAETARMLAELVAGGARVLAFVRSRHGAEQTALSAQRRLAEIAPELVDRVAAYRGRLPARGAARAGGGAELRAAARRGDDERAGARRGHLGAGRGDPGRLSGDVGVDVAAGGSGRAR